MNPAGFVDGNRITLLHNGAEYFPALESAIDGAQQEVHLETYIFEHDATGSRIAGALQRAAQRGVATHLLLDGFGSQDLPRKVIQEMLDAGVQVLIFRQKISSLSMRRNRLRRMHRKLAVVDASIAFVGGINIIDDLHNPERLPPRFDYTVSIEGPLLGEIHSAVKHLWMLVSWAHFSQRRPDYPVLHPVGKPCGSQRATFVIRDNLRHRHDIEQAYLYAIAHADSEIIIANAYFLPGGNFRRALGNAARRGVRVILLLQGRAEYHLQHHATHALYGSLLEAGIEIYEYHQSYLHAKVAVIDERWATVGSSNIDPFSLLLAREANVVVDDVLFATELRSSLEQAMAEGSTQVLRENWQRQSWSVHIMSWASYYVVRFLQGLMGYSRESDRAELDS